MKYKKQISRNKFARVVEEEYKSKRLVNNNQFMQKYELCGVFLDKNFRQIIYGIICANYVHHFRQGDVLQSDWGVYRNGFAYMHRWDVESGPTYWRYKVKPVQAFFVDYSYGQED